MSATARPGCARASGPAARRIKRASFRDGGIWLRFRVEESVMRYRVVAVLLVLSVVGLPASTATADTKVFRDGGAASGPMDIQRVVVVNEGRLQIRVVVDDLQRRHGRSASVWIDKTSRRPGAEFFIGSGLYESDWQIGRARRWRVVGNGPLNCPVDQRLNYQRDVIIWATGTACLGQYSRIRVSVETQKGNRTDYSPRRHRFHDWVARR